MYIKNFNISELKTFNNSHDATTLKVFKKLKSSEKINVKVDEIYLFYFF